MHQEYRSIASAVATWDGELPDAEIMEDPDEFRRWFDDWMELRRTQRGDSDSPKQEHGWVLR